MRTRSKAIQNAVTKYNDAAKQLTPPRDPLNWKRIEQYNFVEEFALLRKTRNNVVDHQWSNIEVHEAMKLHQRIKRAEEELVRVDVEARRLYTSINDEEVDFEEAKKRLAEEGDHVLSEALNDFCQERRKDNALNLHYLQKLTELEKFRGDRNIL